MLVVLLALARLPQAMCQERQSTPPAVLPASTASSLPLPGRPERKSPFQRQMERSARAGADWLCRANQSNGRFIPGYVPALKIASENDSYLRQAGAALALARAAQFRYRQDGKDDRWAAVARQALLTLLLDTETDPRDATIRYSVFPPAIVDRGAAAGLLVQAINELPSPADDLLDQSEQLCRFIGRSQQADGSLRFAGSYTETIPAGQTPESAAAGAAQALCGLMSSQRYRPADWKLAVVKRAIPHYREIWHSKQSLAMTPALISACAIAFAQTRDEAFAGLPVELADWLCSFQYVQINPHHPLWLGGFMPCTDGRPSAGEPRIDSAAYAEALADAYQVARLAGDASRARRYEETMERGLQFVISLQYTEANVQHFAEWYRPVLLGGFHASGQDGNLRIDYNQQAVCALCKYLMMAAG
jgi:hypothetical protein